MMEITLIDSNIQHIPSFNGYDVPKHITWKRDGRMRKVNVYSDHYLNNVGYDSEAIQIAWLMEPSVINLSTYAAMYSMYKHYDYIISHDQVFLQSFPVEKKVFCPGSGSSLYSSEWKIYPKTKLVLTVVGDKRKTIGHKFRHTVAAALGDKIDIRGREHSAFDPTQRAEVYAPYMYQVAIHNNLTADYWSDILIDCFATGTVPIVWGSRYLHKYFDIDGLIFFDTIEELKKILNEISEEDYLSRMQAIRENFKTAYYQYKVMEDYLYDNFLKQFDESTSDIS